MDRQPFFSIITVTFNAAEVIAPTLQSISNQSYTNYELIVQDGASTDGTIDCVKRAGIARVGIWSEPDGGLYDAMNRAAAKASGRYLIFLNAGDSFAATDALQRLHDAVGSGNPGVVYGQTQLVDSEGRVVGMRHLTAPEHLTWQSFRNGMLVCHQAFVVRRDLFAPYDLSYRLSADYEWCIRMLKASPANAYAGAKPIISFLSDDGLTNRNHRASLIERYHIMCRYYGTVPTIMRHLSFVPRYAMRKLQRALK